MVLPQRFELWTDWLRISCSTYWATGVYGAPQGIWTLDPLIKSQMLYHWASGAYGAPWEIQTPNLLVRSQTRYPIAPKRHMVTQGRIELPHRDFQSPALPTELSGHMAESEGLEPSMRCRTTVFRTARLPIITTLQLAETERVELSRAFTPNSLANCPLHHLGKSPCFGGRGGIWTHTHCCTSF